jgi:hypothetical protein
MLFFRRLILLLEERDGGNLHILEAMRHLRREPTQNFKEAAPSPSYSGGGGRSTVQSVHFTWDQSYIKYFIVHTVSLLTSCNYEIRRAIFY